MMHSLLTEPSGHERESATGPIHPGALPTGSGASETAWELAALVSQAGAVLDGSIIQQGHKCARATSGGHVWMVVAPQSDWMEVCALRVLPRTSPVLTCQRTNGASPPTVVDKRLPVFSTVSSLPWICIFVGFVLFFLFLFT